MEEIAILRYTQSEALRKNLLLTNVPVEIDPNFMILEDIVREYEGKRRQASDLIKEYHHKFRNWMYVVQETWRYAISNFLIYTKHPLNGRVIYLLSRILLDALHSHEDDKVRNLAADHLLGFWLKVIREYPKAISPPLPPGFSTDYGSTPVEGITSCHQGILRATFLELSELPDTAFQHVMKSLYQPRKLATELLGIWSEHSSFMELRRLLTRLLKETYQFWLGKDDPFIWLANQPGVNLSGYPISDVIQKLGVDLSHEYLRTQLNELLHIEKEEKNHKQAVARLIQLPDFQEIVRAHQRLPRILKEQKDSHQGAHLSMLVNLKIIETKGLEGIHEEILREVNFDLVQWIHEEPLDIVCNRIGILFDVLKHCLKTYPEAALQCVRTIGLEILDSGRPELIDLFVKSVIKSGFQTPRLKGVSSQWQVKVNPAHLTNVRIWLELIEKNPKATKNLLSALIINLSLGGICIRDTDLFQKDISRLLHSPIKSSYNLIKQLAKLFPVYFNQIGAEGQLRSVSTDLDEISGRKDRLIHFLRKQSHVESNNLIVYFMEAIIHFWRTLDREPLRQFVPPEVYREISPRGPWIDDIHRIFEHLFRVSSINHARGLLDLDEETILRRIDEVKDVPQSERKRAFLAIRLYQLLHEKYALSFKDIRVHLERAAQMGLGNPESLLSIMESNDTYKKLDSILDYLLELKEIILSPGKLECIENIYHKRHIAVDIPSMYGSYNERKFDALGLTFRLENLANVLFEELILSFNLRFITRATFFQITRILPLFLKALAIDGISSRRLERQEELFKKAVEIRRFSHSQYIDIFRGFSEAIKQIIQSYYNSVHEENLETIIQQMPIEEMLPRYQRTALGENMSRRIQRISETFLRELVTRTFGLQYFDHFISSILTTLAAQREHLSPDRLDLLLSYDPEKTVSQIYNPNPKTYDLIHLGNKAYNLIQLHRLGIRVPPGFVITTEYFRCRDVIEYFAQPKEDFIERVMENIRELERITGRRFGSPHNTLLVSVRSGSVVSMPGMMCTLLNVGINEEIVQGLIKQTGQAWFAWDNYRRFIQSWGMAFGIARDEFDAIMAFYKRLYKRSVKREFPPREIREIALAYKNALKEHGIEFSDDPKEQLLTAIRQVVQSWYYPTAVTYRQIMGLSENWGTAVTIQAMIFGNLDTKSGAGVMFTHNPWTSEEDIDPNGDFTFGNQGEDVVGGLVKTLPLTEKQRVRQGRMAEPSLESLFPRVYKRLYAIAEELTYHHNWGPQEIEFTFQGDSEDDVYILQSRNMAPRLRRVYPVFKPTDSLKSAYLSSGIGVSGGALCGRIAFDLKAIKKLRKENPDKPIILIRSDTVPDDIHEISIADGILTGKGGATSHAAIVAHRLGKTCVVGCSNLQVWESEGRCVINGHSLQTGDVIGIDGQSGAIYLGEHEIQKLEVVE